VKRSLAEVLHDGVIAARIATERNGPIWGVTLDDPPTQLFCDRDNFELPNTVAVLSACRIPISMSKTDNDNVALVNAEHPICSLGVPEPFMPLFVGTLRKNGLHGKYRQSGTDKEYEF